MYYHTSASESRLPDFTVNQRTMRLLMAQPGRIFLWQIGYRAKKLKTAENTNMTSHSSQILLLG